MSSNQDAKQKELAMPMTAIEVMNDLSLDASYLLDLAYKGLLLPFIPPVLSTDWITHSMNSTTIQERYLSMWRYRKSDVEEFKIKHKVFLEEIQKQKATPPAEFKKHGPPESEEPVSNGKKDGEQSKKRRSRSSDDREQAITLVKLYVDQHQTKKKLYTLHEAAIDIKDKLKKPWLLRTFKRWIAPYCSDEAKQPGRPEKKK